MKFKANCNIKQFNGCILFSTYFLCTSSLIDYKSAILLYSSLSTYLHQEKKQAAREKLSEMEEELKAASEELKSQEEEEKAARRKTVK